jgi:hypothetical protein
MPIEFYVPTPQRNCRFYDPLNPPPIARHFFMRDKDGVEHEIKSEAQLQAILDQMTPEEFETWKVNYRFTPITNGTSMPGYSGGSRDLNRSL